MNDSIKDTLKTDFQKFMTYCLGTNGGFGFEEFGDYTTSVLNFYVGSSVLKISEKEAAAYYLCQLYNQGIQNVMSRSDMEELAHELAGDPTLEYAVLRPIFD
ncbi:hypothetical protein [Sphingobacterium sp. SYP-B4668]|uniref:hypothetical protein n=1 Tax=Sphingobacterium sp. SYP-B4668 TaxID=2996035 RepID=UPI0022DCF56F|nr:hypothetical protein [Sphingobacterium sp. SYP-B4668]